MPETSVIVNCHNGAEFLRDCLDSIFGQSVTNWEIIFWDNFSSDNSLEIAKSYGPKVRCFRSDSKTSLGLARKLAMQKAKGEFIAFLDTDDIWLPHHLAIQVQFMKSNEYLASYAGIQEIRGDGKFIRDVIPEFSSGPQLRNILRQFEINVPTMMLHRSLVFNYGFIFNPSISIVEEFELFVRISVEHEIGVIKDVLAKYRVHDQGMTQKTPHIAAKERDIILKQLMEKHPAVYAENTEHFAAAFSRSAYYRARACAESGDLRQAREEFSAHRHENLIYYFLYFSFWLPKIFWQRLNVDDLKRKPIFAAVLRMIIKK